MRQYEFMYIVRPDIDEEATKAVVESLASTITSQGGEITEQEEMGRRRLAYEINDFTEGYYVLVNFEAEPEIVVELERVVNINENVIRHIVVNEDE